MLKNYLKIALRNMGRQKVHTAISICGLAIGLACSLMIMLFVYDELCYDRFHDNAGRIYRILLKTPSPAAPVTVNTPAVLAPKLQSAFPELQNLTRLEKLWTRVSVRVDEKQFTETRFFFGEPSIFEIFSFRLLRGDRRMALTEPNSVILTASTAQRYFGDAKAIGKQIEVTGKGQYIVTGVMEDVPRQSHVHFDFLASLSSLNIDIKRPWDHWAYTYLLLPENATVKAVEEKLNTIANNYEFLGWGIHNMKFRLQPLTEIHLHSHFAAEIEANSDIRYVRIFSLIAGLVLLMACINYMNLSTARSAKRAREVGIRKVVGSARRQLALQFLGESILFSGLAMLLAIFLVELSLPAFNEFVGKELSVKLLRLGWFPAGLGVLTLLTGVAAGSYPAFYLSAFRPIKTLKGLTQEGTAAAGVRKILVLIQFAAAVSLIVSAVVIQNQLAFIRNKRLGFDKDNTLLLPISGTQIKKKARAFKAEVMQHPDILRASAASGGPIEGAAFYSSLKNARLQIVMVDEDYMPTLGIELAEGRNFSPAFPGDSSAFMLNQSAVKLLGWDNPLEEQFTGGFLIEKGPVIGVVKDYHNKSLHAPIEPMVFQYTDSRWNNYLILKIRMQHVQAVLKFLEEKWHQFEPGRPFEYSFLDEDYDKLYRSEQRMASFFVSFSGLTIFIACLGLFGLAAFAAERRTKEIGIRKVLGATVANVVGLLSKDFVKLVLLADLIAWPGAWWAMNKWLENFAYRISIGWWVFALAGGLALVIALVTVSTQAVKAALANPVESLRYE